VHEGIENRFTHRAAEIPFEARMLTPLDKAVVTEYVAARRDGWIHLRQ